MGKFRIAVTATGGGVGQSIIKALKDTDYEVIALDGERLGAGLYMVPESYLIPYATDSEYVPFLLNLCKEKQIDLLFPGMDCELFKLSNAQLDFKDIKTKVIVSRKDIIELADDKLKTQEFLRDHGFPFIKTATNCDYPDKWPCSFEVFVKPRKAGARSKDAKLIDLRYHSENLDGMVIQEYIEGDEYT